MHVISDHEMLKRLWRRRALQYPAADLVFKKIDSRHRQETDVVQIGRNGRSELVGSTDPRETDREHRFQTVKRREPEKDSESPRTGWLVTGYFTLVDGGYPYARFFAGTFGAGQSQLVLHVKVTDVDRGSVVYEFDMAGGSRFQGRHGTVRASGLGRATHFDLVNAAERVYLTLSANPYRYGERANVSLPE